MFHLSKLDVKLTRRTALKVGALTAAAVAVGIPMGSLKETSVKAAGTESGESKQLGFSYDQNKCINCKLCAKACKQTNNWEPGAEWRKVHSAKTEKGSVFLSMSCNHCEEPACMTVCPVKAYTKREKDGIVVHDTKKCVGCAYCVYACPYHAPQFIKSGTGAVTKCSFCVEIQDAGGQPACVTACPVDALNYGDMTELRKIPGAVAPEVNGLPPVSITNPSFVIIPKA
ncbi:Fe-S-cluster-containing hydrogenase subunit [Desulfitobacterium dichloroeliminans LMG P-21439]|uniref:Fe-S-cluster-containing hydrogenase subunit n=1 Tax=Desulfitobacterium dichloroeliminans (strain LMG P-21439 / DCA1) TaxID=871963 RepID=L0F9P5_DESDL|nr:Fe-S-cluster-containing hydrogenase subunit [Desulfitobacterium dichloroeliminans LMG P-21439]